MSSNHLNKDELIATLKNVEREQRTATVLWHSAIANHFGQNFIDWICADIIQRQEALTAGELAKLTGLTTGAITGLIDRLEKAGIVKREPDPNDRRRVIVKPVPSQVEELDSFFSATMDSFWEMAAAYSDEELAFIIDFKTRATRLMEAEAIQLRTGKIND